MVGYHGSCAEEDVDVQGTSGVGGDSGVSLPYQASELLPSRFGKVPRCPVQDFFSLQVPKEGVARTGSVKTLVEVFGAGVSAVQTGVGGSGAGRVEMEAARLSSGRRVATRSRRREANPVRGRQAGLKAV